MKLIFDLINQIIRNKFIRKFCISLIAILLIGSLLNKAKEFEINSWLFAIIMMIFIALSIYVFTLIYRITYDLTSISRYKTDISLSNFFWLTIKYQFIFGLIVFVPSMYIFNSFIFAKAESVKNIEEMSSIFRNPILIVFQHTAEYLYLTGLVVVIGSRAFDSFSAKVRILFFSKSTVQIIIIIIALSLLIEVGKLFAYPNYSDSTFYFLFSLVTLIGYLTSILILIREWQKLYFESAAT